MNTRILVAFDGSAQAMRAVDKALEFFGDYEAAQIDVVCAIPYGGAGGAREGSPMVPLSGLGNYYCDQNDIADSISSAKAETLQKMHAALDAKFEDAACKVVYVPVVSSVIADGIADYAEEIKADLIIMGCRGLGGVRAALGSVSLAVLKQVPMPVTLIK